MYLQLLKGLTFQSKRGKRYTTLSFVRITVRVYKEIKLKFTLKAHVYIRIYNQKDIEFWLPVL